MAEYIEREAILRHKRKMSGADFGGEFWDEVVLCEDIKKIPAADVAEVRHGRWVKTSEYMPIYGCSICKERNLFRDGNNVFSNYCPNCGVKMDGKGDSDEID